MIAYYIRYIIRLFIWLLLIAGIGIQLNCKTLTRKDRLVGIIKILFDIYLLTII